MANLKEMLSKEQKSVQHYHHMYDNEKNGSYIPKAKKERIWTLAQKSYDERIVRLARKRLGQIGRILRDYDDDEIEKIYLKEHDERKKLIHPVEPTWEPQLENWLGEEYKKKEFREGALIILTEKGERVRSKSEKNSGRLLL